MKAWMEFVKRHAFLLGLAGGVVAILLLSGVCLYFFVTRPNRDTQDQLQQIKIQANALREGPVYTDVMVAQITTEAGRRKKQYEDILGYIRILGAQRQPLVKGLFPLSTDESLRHTFKAKYDGALNGFMLRLRAIKPAPIAEQEHGKAGASEDLIKKNRQAVMFVDSKAAFFRPAWVDEPKAPTLDMVREGQEDIWLMENLVDILAAMNEDAAKAGGLPPVIANVPVKELIEIRIGQDAAGQAGGQPTGGGTRYRIAALEGAAAPRTATLTGHASKEGLYQVLPFRVVVVVDARYVAALIHRLKDTESFITPESWVVKPLTKAMVGGRAGGVLASSLEDYGPNGVVRLEVVGESLIFQLEGGRVTTLPKAQGA